MAVSLIWSGLVPCGNGSATLTRSAAKMDSLCGPSANLRHWMHFSLLVEVNSKYAAVSVNICLIAVRETTGAGIACCGRRG